MDRAHVTGLEFAFVCSLFIVVLLYRIGAYDEVNRRYYFNNYNEYKGVLSTVGIGGKRENSLDKLETSKRNDTLDLILFYILACSHSLNKFFQSYL